MDSRPVLFLDSGIGGLPYFTAFRSLAPEESLVYVADRANYPYGPKNPKILADLLLTLIQNLRKRVDPKLVVVACNTASIAALQALREAFPDLPFVGTVPAVKPAVLFSKTKQIGVLATEATIEDPYIQKLARKYDGSSRVIGLAAPELVDFIESRYSTATESERYAFIVPYVDYFLERGADTLVLGCTHFLYLAEEMRRAAGMKLRVFDSLDGVAQRALNVLLERRLMGTDGGQQYRLLSTGSDVSPLAAIQASLSELYGMTVERFP